MQSLTHAHFHYVVAEIARYEDDVKDHQDTNCTSLVDLQLTIDCDIMKVARTLYTLFDQSQTDRQSSHANYESCI